MATTKTEISETAKTLQIPESSAPSVKQAVAYVVLNKDKRMDKTKWWGWGGEHVWTQYIKVNA